MLPEQSASHFHSISTCWRCCSSSINSTTTAGTSWAPSPPVPQAKSKPQQQHVPKTLVALFHPTDIWSFTISLPIYMELPAHQRCWLILSAFAPPTLLTHSDYSLTTYNGIFDFQESDQERLAGCSSSILCLCHLLCSPRGQTIKPTSLSQCWPGITFQ